MNLSAAALAEFTRRRTQARQALARGTRASSEAERHVRLWAGIAAWFGAALPDDLRPYADAQGWLDHCPHDCTADQWRRALAAELRRAAEVALAASEHSPAPDLVQRARTLLALDRVLSLRAGLPPIGAAPAQLGAPE